MKIAFPPGAASGGGGANVDGSNVTTPSTWRAKLDIPSQSDVNNRLIGILGGVVFDNVTANQRAYASLLDWNVGTSDFSVTTRLELPAAVTTSNAPIWCLSNSYTTAAPFSMTCRLEAGTNALQLAISGTTQDSYRRLYWNSFLSTYAGLTVQLTVTRISGVITIYVDGTDITSNFSEFTNAGSGVMPAGWSETVMSPWLLIGGIAASSPGYAGKISRVTVWNYGLSATQVLQMRNQGVWQDAQWTYVSGANNILCAERNATFAKAATDWVPTGGGTSISAAGAVVLGAAGGSVSLSGLSGYLSQLVPGALYSISFDVASGTFGANSVSAYFGTAVADTSVSLGSFNANGSYTFEFTPTFGLGVLNLIAVTGGSNFTLSNVRITRVLLTNGSFETSGGGSGTWGGTSAAAWTATPSGTTAITRDTSIKRSSAASVKIVTDGSNSNGYIAQTTGLIVGRKYRISFWARGGATAATEKVSYRIGDAATLVETTLSTTWQRIVSPEIVYTGTFSIGRGSTGSNGQTIYIDDVEMVEIGAVSDFSPSGLDNMTPMWRNGNPQFPDAAIIGLTQDATGRWNGIISTEGKPWGAHGNLGRIARESGAQSNGGVVLPGNANQRLTISNGQAIGTNAFWVRQQFVMPASNPGSTRGLFCFSASATPGSAANAFLAYITTAGALEVAIYGATGSDSRILTVYDAVLRYGGRVVDVFVTRATTGAVAIWINGERQFGVESTNGTTPTFAATISSTYIFWGASSTSAVFTGELNRVQLGRGVLTDALVRQVMNAGVGTGSGASAGTPISRGGIMASADGLVIENDLTQGWGTTYPDVAALTSTGPASSQHQAISYLGDETHKIPSVGRRLNFQDADRRFSGGCASGAATVTSYGDTFTVQGTPSSSAADANQPQCVNCASAASVGSLTGYYSSAIHYVGRNPRMATLLRLVELTNVVVYCGLHSGAANGLNNTDTPNTLSAALFRFSPTRAGDTTWKCITDDGTAQTTNDSLVVPTTNVLLLEIEIISGQRVNFYIDGRLVKSNVTNLPAASAMLRWQMVEEARDAAAHNIKFINADINS